MNKKEYEKVIIMFEESVNGNCCAEVQNMKIEKDIIVADILIEFHHGATVVYKDMKYKRKELENDTIFMRS